jgi:hypothetical protein
VIVVASPSGRSNYDRVILRHSFFGSIERFGDFRRFDEISRRDPAHHFVFFSLFARSKLENAAGGEG